MRQAMAVVRDAAVEFAAAATVDAISAAVDRAVSGLSTGRDRPRVRLISSDRVAVNDEAQETDVRVGALLVDRRTAMRADVWVALEAISAQVALALDRVRLTAEIAGHGQDQLNALVEQTADVILIVNDDNRIRYASPSARALLGRSALRDVSLPDLVDPAERRSAEFMLRHSRQADPKLGGGGARADWTMQALDGRRAQVEVSCRDLRAEESIRGVVVTLRDVTAQRQLEQELTKRVFYDPLTGLPNRLLFGERVNEAIAAQGGVTGVLLIDLDNFRAINEGLGRETGDAVIKAVGTRLQSSAGDDCVTAHLGADEFAVLVRNATGVHDIDKTAARIARALAAPILGGGDVASCTGSVGVATTAEAASEQELLRHADLALDMAKAAGDGQWRRYEPSMTNAVRYRQELRSALGRAPGDHSMIVEYQPIVEFGTGRTAGFEALLRWRHPTRGLLSPGEFIGIAEESGLIAPIGEWVLATAIKAAREWHGADPEDPPFVSVNVSAQQFRSKGFVDTVGRLLAEAGLPPGRLVLEITESLLLRDDEDVWEDLKRLRQRGIRVAIDDFGTGYSALGYLRQVPLDIVKLDRIFISTMTHSTRQRELVRGIVTLTRTLNLAVVAEGIETERQRDVSASIGCAYGQGYHFSRSMSDADAVGWLARERTAASAADSSNGSVLKNRMGGSVAPSPAVDGPA